MTWQQGRDGGRPGQGPGLAGGRGGAGGRPATAARPAPGPLPPLPPLAPVPPRNALEAALKRAAASLGRFGSAEALAAFLAGQGVQGARGSDRRGPLSAWLGRQEGLEGAVVIVTAGIAEARHGGLAGLCALPLCAYKLELLFDAGMHPELDCQPATSRKRDERDERDRQRRERQAQPRPAKAGPRKAGAGGPAASQPLLPGLGTPAPAQDKRKGGGR